MGQGEGTIACRTQSGSTLHLLRQVCNAHGAALWRAGRGAACCPHNLEAMLLHARSERSHRAERAHQVHIGVVPNGDQHVADGAAQQVEAAGEEPDQHIQHLRGG